MRSYLVLNLLGKEATFEIKNRQVFDTFLENYRDPDTPDLIFFQWHDTEGTEVSSYIHCNSISDISYAERES